VNYFRQNLSQNPEFCTMAIRLSLTMIVKDEAATLGRCLSSVRDILDEIVVVDTGSTDCSKEIAASFGARVYDFIWRDDFAAARNEALRHTTGDWIFWLDADEYLDHANHQKMRHLVTCLKDDNIAFVMTQRSLSSDGASHVPQVRLFRKHPSARWEYRVHERPLPSLLRAGYEIRGTDIVITHTGYQDRTTYTHKMKRNLPLLLLDQSDHPDDPVILYNLGHAYFRLEAV
jgi:glycosyltransferase involved in cell wall biosynthesis